MTSAAPAAIEAFISSTADRPAPGGYWAEVPAIPGCASDGETMDELLANVREAIDGCLAEIPDGNLS